MNKIKILELLELLEVDKIDIRKSGHKEYINFPCLFAESLHENGTDNNPSNGIIVDDEGYSSYKCFTCGSHGTIPKMLRKLANLTGEEIYRDLSNKVAKEEKNRPYPDYEKSRRIFSKKENTIVDFNFLDRFNDIDEYSEVIEYLKTRNIIDLSVISRLKLKYDEVEKRIIFPIYDNNEILHGCTSRTILKPSNYPTDKVYKNKRYKYAKVKDYFGLRKTENILGIELWKKGKPILIQEGIIGYLYLHSIGVNEYFNIGAILGASLSDTQAELIINTNEDVVLLMDNDSAGEIGIFGDEENKIGGALDKLNGHCRVIIPEYPFFADEPDELLLEQYKKLKSNEVLFDNEIYFKG